ncbi:hypothetical protein COI67_06000, partial [Bacillus cereus]
FVNGYVNKKISVYRNEEK